MNSETDVRISEAEKNIPRHISMWGSDGYPIRKLGKGRWIWHEFYGVKGPPKVFKTKREVIDAFEKYLEILRDKKAGRLP